MAAREQQWEKVPVGGKQESLEVAARGGAGELARRTEAALSSLSV